MTHFCDDWSMSYRRGKEKEKKRNERKKWATEKNQENQLEWGLKWNFWNFLFRMSEGDENNSSPPRPGLVQYLQRDPVTSIMFGLRIYTFFAGCMSILNPYRYWIFEFFGFFFFKKFHSLTMKFLVIYFRKFWWHPLQQMLFVSINGFQLFNLMLKHSKIY